MRTIILLISIALSAAAHAQTSPGFSGALSGNNNPLTASALNSAIAGKRDHVATVAALRAWAPASPGSSVHLGGYYTDGDGGGGDYQWSATSIGSDDGCGIIKPASRSTGRWLRVIDPAGLNVRACGAKGDGVTDDTAALQTAASVLSAAGGGQLLLTPGQSLINSANFTVPSNVHVNGNAAAVGLAWSTPFASLPYSLLVNPAYSVVLSNNSGISGTNIIRTGFAAATSLRSALTGIAAFAGTAISCSAAADIHIDHVTILGFAQAITSTCDRTHISNVRGDDTAGVLLTGLTDTPNLENVEFWPFILNGNFTFATQSTAVLGAVSYTGGSYTNAIELTLAAATTAPVTGDTVVVGNVGGVPAATGRWTITALDATHIVLGGTFAGTYTSGGTVFLNAIQRHGAAFDFENMAGGPFGYNLLAYGADTGIHYGGTTTGAICIACWVDTWVAQNNPDPVPVGVLMDGATGPSYFSGYINEPARQIVVNSTSGAFGLLSVSNTQIPSFYAWTGVMPVQVNQGSLSITGGSFISGGAGGSQAGLYVADAAYSAKMSGVANIGPVTTTYQTTATDCPKVSIDGTVGPCPWTPTLIGSTTAGTQTYSSQAGSYTVTGGTLVNLWGRVALATFTGATGNAVIGGLPSTPGAQYGANDGGGCALGAFQGITFTSGYTQLIAGINGGVAAIALNEEGTGTGVLGVNAATQVAGTASVQVSCQYHQ